MVTRHEFDEFTLDLLFYSAKKKKRKEEEAHENILVRGRK